MVGHWWSIPPKSHHLTLLPDSVESELKLRMTDNTLSFDELPGAVQSLTSLVKDLAKEVLELRQQIRILSGEPSKSVEFVGIDEAVRILGKAKSTIYGLAREGRLPAYKVPGEKEWRFISSELVEFVKGNKRESCLPSFEDMEAMLSRGTRCRHNNK